MPSASSTYRWSATHAFIQEIHIYTPYTCITNKPLYKSTAASFHKLIEFWLIHTSRRQETFIITSVLNSPQIVSIPFQLPLARMAGVPSVEAMWGTIINTFSEYQLRTIVTFIVHEVFYWGSYVPFLIAERLNFCNQWKLQPDKHISMPLWKNCVKRLLLNHFLLVLPIILLTHPVMDLMGAKHSVETLPSPLFLAAQVLLFFAIEDFVFYWGHRALHTPYLYKNVHQIHHEHSAPFGLAAEYAHPFEVIFLGAATLAGPILFSPHLLTLYTYLALRCVQTVECHSGYDFPWSLNRWFPFYGGAHFHDHHHRIHSGNYSSTFTWVDALFGTDTAFQIWMHKRKRLARGEPS